MILSMWYKNVKGIYEEILNIKINGLNSFVLWKFNNKINHAAVANTMKREQTFDYMQYRRFNEIIIT